MHRDEFASLLRMGVDHWNQWRAEHPSERVELGGWRGEYLNLRDADLAGANFHDCTFVYTCMDGAKLIAADFSGATFYKSNSIENADLTGANLSGASVDYPDQGFIFSLKGSNLRGANLRKCTLWGDLSSVDLSEADLSDADLGRSRLTKANLSYAVATSASFQDGSLGEVNFAHSNLRQADFESAFLHGANFSESDISESVFGAAECPKANFSNANLERVDLRYVDLTNANFAGARLRGVNLSGAVFRTIKFHAADLTGANLEGADLTGVDLSHACLIGAHLDKATLEKGNLSDANLSGARLCRATLTDADFSRANLSNTVLQRATLVRTVLDGASLNGARIYGASVWDVRLNGAEQLQLVITPEDQPKVIVDNLEVAQFIYLLLKNEKVRHIIDTIGAKGVLILGRFTKERKPVLDAIRDKLRALGFVPILFDFEKPVERDFTETIKTLAGLSKFIIADITNPKSSPLELQATMPDYMVPFVPIIQEDEEPFSMFCDLKQKYSAWVLDVLKYDSVANLLNVFEHAVVKPALDRADELTLKKSEALRFRHVKDYR